MTPTEHPQNHDRQFLHCGPRGLDRVGAKLHVSHAPAEDTLDTLPLDTHPMTQLSVAMLALQKDSKFNQQYQEGMKKDQYWAPWCH